MSRKSHYVRVIGGCRWRKNQFPSETEMMADPVIQAHAANLWAQTLALCTPTNGIPMGHPLNAPARLYPTEICPRRMRQ